MRVKTTAVALGLAALLVWVPASAQADTIKVAPGASIQAAVDKAKPGDTIKLREGTYRESVSIAHDQDRLTIRGAGADDTVIVPPTPQPADPADCPQNQHANGISAEGDVDQATSEVKDPIEDLRITGLAVKGFTCGDGIFLLGAKDATVTRVLATGNGGYGIVAFNSTGGNYSHNEAAGSEEAGIYVGDSPNADSTVRGNVSHDNGIGIFIRDASNGEVAHNKVFGNCAGILFLETGAPTTNSGWVGRENLAVKNDKACPAAEGPPFSGIGIAVVGVSDILVKNNRVLENRPSGPSPLGSGGIVVVSSTDLGGGDVSGARIVRNKAFGNEAYDLSWDEKGTATFTANQCKTSKPVGLCKSARRHGKGDDGNGGDHGGSGKGDDDDNGHHRGGDDGDDDHASGRKNDDAGKRAHHGDCKRADRGSGRASDGDHDDGGRGDDHDD